MSETNNGVTETSNAAEESGPPRFSNRQLAFLREHGKARAGGLFLTDEFLAELAPSRTRSESSERIALIKGLIEAAQPDEKGVRAINAKTMLDAGLSPTFATTSAPWSGVSVGAEICASLGYAVEYRAVLDRSTGGTMGHIFVRARTPADDTKRTKLLAKRAPAATPAPAADAGSAETGELSAAE